LPQHRALVCSFAPGKLLTADDARDPVILSRIAQTIRRCHDHPVAVDLGAFSAFATVRRYHKLAREKGVALPAELGKALILFERIEQELKTDEPPCLCHNDLLAGNFIDDGTTMRIIDWEYGGLGDRFFDLGNFAVNLQLDAAQEQALLKAYFADVRPEQLRRLRLMRLVSDLREATWGYLQSAISTLTPAEPYTDYGKRHLERFLAGARSFSGGSTSRG
jgi:thiamine kinase-like enzyme